MLTEPPSSPGEQQISGQEQQASTSRAGTVSERSSPGQPDPLDEALDAGHLEARSVSASFTSSRGPYRLVAPTPATLQRRQQMIVLTITSLHLR